MQHIFIDVEALGPPGIGRPFAVGAVKFDMTRGVYERWQGLVKPRGEVDGVTMAWLSKQSVRVHEQLRGGQQFHEVWTQAVRFFFGDRAHGIDPISLFWADDWSDFAWLDIEARACNRSPLRTMGAQYDSSAIVALADPLKVYSTVKYGEIEPHVAVDDALTGALDLIAALNILGRGLPGDKRSPGASPSYSAPER